MKGREGERGWREGRETVEKTVARETVEGERRGREKSEKEKTEG